MRAAFYMPDNHFYYEITLFGWMKIDLEVSVLTNAIDVNFNYTKSNNSYSIHHNPDALYISMLEGSTVSAHIDSLHHNLIPAVVAEYAEFAVESFVGIFVDTGLIFFVRAGLTDFLYQSLVAAVSSIDMRDIFDGQSQCGSLTL
ncbi:hypothetical protein GE061_015341 [Apolygus lucorum]|uniref:Uncharacterized protein n=1 Tax=Apolygus lucorum TaxID=248454 RepID=A0A8S9XKU9_APOLU|nr:hypothetical protein GE061_015341 [Apolygus lucorum]